MYPLMQLGGEKEMIEQAQVGALQIARISTGAMARSSTSSTCSTCRSVPRRAHMRKVIDGPIGQDLLAKVHRDRMRAWSRWAGWTRGRATCTRTSRSRSLRISRA
jgi:TRAP-type C4-dicarboxylate transport system substrate-binding protein